MSGYAAHAAHLKTNNAVLRERLQALPFRE